MDLDVIQPGVPSGLQGDLAVACLVLLSCKLAQHARCRGLLS